MRKSLRSIAWVLLVGAVLAVVVAPLVYAATTSLTYTTAQDNRIQGAIIKNYNRRHCARFGRNEGCGSNNLVNNGCVQVSVCTAAGLKVGSSKCNDWSTEFVESCTIFTQDAAGQAAYAKEILNQAIANEYATIKASEATDFCIAWDTLNNSAQNAQCAALGLGNGCRPCPEQP